MAVPMCLLEAFKEANGFSFDWNVRVVELNINDRAQLLAWSSGYNSRPVTKLEFWLIVAICKAYNES